MAHDAGLPSTWAKVGQDLHANSLWILPLAASERAFDEHYYQAAFAVVLWLVSAYAAVQLDVFREVRSSPERRRQLLTWTLIICGAALLGLGVYRLAQQEPGVDLEKATAPIQSRLDEVIRQKNALQTDLDRLKSAPAIFATQEAPALTATRRMSGGDKQRLSEFLYEFSQLLDEANTLWRDALSTGREASTMLYGNKIPEYVAKLRGFQKRAQDLQSKLNDAKKKSNYYAAQRDFIFVESQETNIVTNAAVIYAEQLNAWSHINNKSEQPIPNLVSFALGQFDESLKPFRAWQAGCEARLRQIRDALQ